jgi:hypothetical protein
MRRVALIGVVVVLAGCVESDPSGGSSEALTIRDCEVTGYGSFPTGEVFSGTFSDVLGVEAVDWLHDAPGVSFETNAVTPAGVTCRQNGADTGIVESYGTATLNGTPGYSYLLEVEDHRDPAVTGSETLAASASTDGSTSFSGGEVVTIPSEIAVTAGNATGAVVTLTLDGLTCTYDEAGGTFLFNSCSDGTTAAGDGVAATTVSLHVEGGACPEDTGHGCRRGHTIGRGHFSHGRGHGYGHSRHDHDGAEVCVPLAVEAVLEWTIPSLGSADFYSLVIGSPSGTTVYTFSGLVFDGDIDIQFL